MAWALIAKGIKILVILPEGERQGAQEYVQSCLEPHLPTLLKVTFQQDNAKSHTAIATQAWLSAHNVRVISPQWPAFSPDLSPVENVWGILKKKVSQRAPYSYAELRRIVMEEFHNIPQGTIDNLVDSFERRLWRVRAAMGAALQ